MQVKIDASREQRQPLTAGEQKTRRPGRSEQVGEKILRAMFRFEVLQNDEVRFFREDAADRSAAILPVDGGRAFRLAQLGGDLFDHPVGIQRRGRIGRFPKEERPVHRRDPGRIGPVARAQRFAHGGVCQRRFPQPAQSLDADDRRPVRIPQPAVELRQRVVKPEQPLKGSWGQVAAAEGDRFGPVGFRFLFQSAHRFGQMLQRLGLHRVQTAAGPALMEGQLLHRAAFPKPLPQERIRIRVARLYFLKPLFQIRSNALR